MPENYEKIEEVLLMEEDLDLKEITHNDLWVYPIVKTQILAVLFKPGIIQFKKHNLTFARSLLKSLVQSSFTYRKFRNCDILYTDRGERRWKVNDVYQNYNMSFLNQNYDVLLYECPIKSVPYHHENIPEKENVLFWDWQMFLAANKYRLAKQKVTINDTAFKQVFEYLKIDYPRAAIIERLQRFWYAQNEYYKIIKKLNPGVVISSIADIAMVYAAKRLNIPIVEMQHGIIYKKMHATNYFYKQLHGTELITDYFFTYGDFFTNLLINNSLHWTNDTVKTIGKIEGKKTDTEKKDKQADPYGILISSQWHVKEQLYSYIKGLLSVLPEKYTVYLKPHPAEDVDPDEYYKEFLRKDNFQIVDKSVHISKASRGVRYHSTVNSTTFMESLKEGCINIFMFIPEYSDIVEDFVDNRYIYLARTPEEYVSILERTGEMETGTIREFATSFFENNPEERLVKEIKDLFNINTINRKS